MGARKRNEIREGKLWEITRVWGTDIRKVEQEIPQADPLRRPGLLSRDKMRTHDLKKEDDTTNLTKNPDLL